MHQYRRLWGGIDIATFALSIQNCSLVTNGAASGGGIYCKQGTSYPTVVSNCTLYGNYGGNGGGVYVLAANPTCPIIQNCIIWGNGATNVYNGSSGVITNSYSDIQGCGGSGAGWKTNMFGNGSSSDGGGNLDTNPLFVDPFNNDIHLKSKGGHWTTNGWVIDSVTSPCIDKGNPSSDYSLEPMPNGGRINMGAYGGTAQASKTPVTPAGTAVMIR